MEQSMATQLRHPNNAMLMDVLNYGAVRESRDAEARRFATKLGVAVKS